MIFHTASGSTYEVDKINKKIRRINGVSDPTPRMGKDGEWRSYITISTVHAGASVVIVWGNETELLPETKAAIEAGQVSKVIPVSTTSPVMQIVDDKLLS